MDGAVTKVVFGFFHAVWSMAGLTPETTTPATLHFTPPDISIADEQLSICGRLEGAVNGRVARVVQTGTLVRLVIGAELAGEGSVLGEQSAVKSIRFDSLEGHYTVSAGDRTQRFESLEAAAMELSSWCVRFAVPREKAQQALEVEAEARLDYKSSAGIEGAAQGLWDHNTPYLRIRDVLGTSSKAKATGGGAR
ncbi:MAG: hypothetical protein WBV82_17150 [Myxococcaceae bacterium]